MNKKFQNITKSKFEKNLPKLFSKTLLKNDKLNKIKKTLQKSKIKNKKALITLNKKVYNNKKSTDILNTSFSELIKSNPNYTIPKFFEVYKDLFYNIPKKGEKSHHSLIEQSQEYINNYNDPLDIKLERLLELLEKKDEEFNLKENPEPKEHLFYPNGTFLRTHGANTEIVEGVPQGLPMWVMHEGMKREFKSYDAFKVAKKSLGFTNMFYDADKQELLGDKDLDITELLHVNDLNYIPTGADINNDSDLNLPPGPDREIDLSLSDILDYYSANITCLEGYDDPDDSNQVKVENYASTHDLRDACYVRYWVLNGTRHTSRGFSPGDTIHAYFRKDNPDFDITDSTLGLNSNILQQQLSGEEDGIFDMKGYMRFDYDHPEEQPTKYVNAPFDTSVSVDTLPAYIEPIYSDYGTRRFKRLGYGDQRKSSGDYKSGLFDKLWEQVLHSPKNAFYNGDYDWSKAKNCDGCENIGPNIRKGGGYNSSNNYSRIYYSNPYYIQYLGRWERSGVYRDRYYYVILNKDYKGHGPLSDARVKYVYRGTHKDIRDDYYKHTYGGALSFSEARKFPQDENGYYIPQEYWDEFGLI
tara:strand:- start:13112 stop:14863 length:1752 start_codon:yes stop_codon:yes gene_type:complete